MSSISKKAKLITEIICSIFILSGCASSPPKDLPEKVETAVNQEEDKVEVEEQKNEDESPESETSEPEIEEETAIEEQEPPEEETPIVTKPIEVTPKPAPTPAPAPKPTTTKPVASPLITTKEESKEVSVPFDTKEVSDESMLKGTSKITQTGADGIEKIVYKVTYTDGKETKREEISRTLLKAPIDAIISIGTKEPEAAPAPPEVKSGTFSSRSTLEIEIFHETNRQRELHGVSPLKWEEGFRTSALAHNTYLFENKLFEHTKIYNVGENLYRLGSADSSKHNAEFIVGKWMNSPGHKANILDPSYTKLGVSVIVGEIYYEHYGRNIQTLYATQHFR